MPKAPSPTVAKAGLMPVTSGTGLGAATAKETGGETPPPGGGLSTVTVAVCAVAMSVASICAASWLAER